MHFALGLFVLRVVVGALLAMHGAQKVTRLFGGSGLQGGIEEFRADGFRGGVWTALAAGLGQIGAGLFLVLGLLTPLAAMAAIGVMTVAVTVKWHKGFWVQHDGIEFPFVLVVVAAALGITGPGAWSLDGLLGLDAPRWWMGLGAAVVGIGSGLIVRGLLHRPASR